MKAIRNTVLIIVVLAGLPSSIAAQADILKNNFQQDFSQSLPWSNRWYIGMDLGVGLLKLSQNNLPAERTPRFALEIHGGYKVFPWLRAGINVSGWLIEPFEFELYQDPKGISISNTFVQLQIFPLTRYNLYINLAGGYSQYINKHPNALNAKGSGGLVGLGYEKDVFRRCGLSVIMNYGFGQFTDDLLVRNLHFDVLEFRVGFTYH